MAVNQAATDRSMGLLDQAPRTLSLVGSNGVDNAREFHQTLAASKDMWFYRSVSGVDHAMPIRSQAYAHSSFVSTLAVNAPLFVSR